MKGPSRIDGVLKHLESAIANLYKVQGHMSCGNYADYFLLCSQIYYSSWYKDLHTYLRTA
jgi:hypothetical protein